ncbi:hypothetical protein FACS1894132_13130 [Clostridia bacterium]|nr:hypothetical protein FACS1894132_13130 [Clostridia bacterium]
MALFKKKTIDKPPKIIQPYTQTNEIEIPEKAFIQKNVGTDDKPKYGYLLTDYELDFYKNQLKPLADEFGMLVIPKVRLADIIEVNKALYSDHDDLSNIFYKSICMKHIDFVIVNPSSFYILFLVELDDVTHLNNKQIERDKLVDKILKRIVFGKSGSVRELKLIHVQNPTNTSEIRKALINNKERFGKQNGNNEEKK